MSQRRIRAYRSGIFPESFVALLLRLKGNRIVARRYKTPVGKIDLVALKGKRLLPRGQAAEEFRGCG
jgi:putative endonuclease